MMKPAQSFHRMQVSKHKFKFCRLRLSCSHFSTKRTPVSPWPLSITTSKTASAPSWKHGRLSVDAIAFGTDADLYDAGMTSHATVNVMLALEGEFDVEFPDELLNRSVFASIASIRNALVGIGQT